MTNREVRKEILDYIKINTDEILITYFMVKESGELQIDEFKMYLFSSGLRVADSKSDLDEPGLRVRQ